MPETRDDRPLAGVHVSDPSERTLQVTWRPTERRGPGQGRAWRHASATRPDPRRAPNRRPQWRAPRAHAMHARLRATDRPQPTATAWLLISAARKLFLSVLAAAGNLSSGIFWGGDLAVAEYKYKYSRGDCAIWLRIQWDCEKALACGDEWGRMIPAGFLVHRIRSCHVL